MVAPVSDKIEIKPGDILIHRFSMDYDLGAMIEIHKFIQQQMPDNKIISIPNDSSLQAVDSLESLREIQENIQKIMEEIGQN